MMEKITNFLAINERTNLESIYESFLYNKNKSENDTIIHNFICHLHD
jgi:hypothetical protein